MRAAPHAGSRPSRCRPPHAALALATAFVVLVALVAGCGHPAAGADAAPASAVALANGPQPPYDDAGYWAFADRLQRRLDGTWDERARRYRTDGGGCESMVNALLLLTHSVAAQTGHRGPARDATGGGSRRRAQ